jgi:hypothetical protein
MLQRIVKQFDNHTLTAFELRYWSKRAHFVVSRWGWVSRVFVGTATILSLMLFVYELIAVQFNINIWEQVRVQLPRNLPHLLAMSGLMLIVFAFMLPYQRARTFTRQVIARDKTNQLAWELIVLTGVDARSYVRAKWWTITKMLAPQFLPTAIIRASLIAFLVGEISRAGAWSQLAFRGGFLDSPTVPDILLIGVLTVLMTYTGVPRLVAGALDDMLDFPRHGNTWWGWTVRGGVSFLEFVVTLLVPILILALIFVFQRDWTLLWVVGMVMLTALDNGTTITIQLAIYLFWSNASAYILLLPHAGWVLLIVVLSLPIVAARMWWTMRLLERTAQRYGLVGAKGRDE